MTESSSRRALRRFGNAQVAALDRIGRSGPGGISEAGALDLSGAAHRYAATYARSIESAVKGHNEAHPGERCAPNCPVGTDDSLILRESWGPQGGRRWCTTRWDRMAETAARMTADEMRRLDMHTEADLWCLTHWPRLGSRH